MNRYGPRSFFQFFARPAALLIVASLVVPGTGQATETEEAQELSPPQIQLPIGLPQMPGALTPPPPLSPALDALQEMTNNKYLKNGTSSIRAEGRSSLRLSAATVCSSAASRSGVALSLQRWDGSAWVLENTATAISESSGSSMLNFSKQVQKGYYYRVRSDHWASGGGLRETSTLFSNTLLFAN
ncbi:hypothetical protein [Saccharibacillus brassicae]|uniref:Uncharacterized protein n=1 Tax=Saccharibacillus brassicae TaxID=2583377 RepID=A0A4Y6UZX0_SACBS|nr:hypothetical protein [Saccharibacillus brassicae]QDH23312.1 hypothetical protein FFV09_22050 [Saccharibacillus brassicae]